MVGMKASSLVLVLVLLGAVVATTQAHPVTCKNTCKKPITVNGVLCGVGKIVTVEVKIDLIIVIEGSDHKKHQGTYHCPKNVKTCTILHDGKYLKLKVTSILSELLGGVLAVVGAVIELVACRI